MKDIASKLGISESYYCAIENGERQKNMDLTLVSGLSAALGISVSRIVKYEKEKT
jgi:transcriptional regulator with XRE-family HTH domain